VVRGTTNPAPCCHLANDIFMQTEDRQTYQPPWTKSAATKRVQTRCPIPLAVILITNKLTFDPPTRLPELTQNVIRSSHGHSTPSLKISCKSVQPFSRNLADIETKKEIARKQYPPTGGGEIITRRRSRECISSPSEFLQTPLLAKFLMVHVSIAPRNIHMSNLKSVALTVLELLAFSAKKFRGSHDPGHAPFLKVFKGSCPCGNTLVKFDRARQMLKNRTFFFNFSHLVVEPHRVHCVDGLGSIYLLYQY